MPATPELAKTGTAPRAQGGAPTSDDIALTPLWLRVLASWSWRLLVIVAVVALLWVASARLSQVVVPLLLALLFTSGLSPMTAWLEKKGWPRWLGSLTALLAMIVVFAGLLTLVGAQIVQQWPKLAEEATKGISGLFTWLATGPLQISESQVDTWIDQALQAIQNSTNQIASGLASAGSTIGSIFAGLAICLFTTFFFLKDGARIAAAFEKIIPDQALVAVEPAVRGGWTSLAAYVRAAVIVAGIDGVGAGLGALILGSNLWVAITAFTFVCSFIPLLGATIAGTVATAVVLVTLGPIKAIIMLVVFVAVMSIEAHVLQPLLLGRAVEIHPLIVLLGISAGAIIAGIPGALFAIPLVAFVNGCIKGSEGIFAADHERRLPTLPWLGRAEDDPDEPSPERFGSRFRFPRPGSKLEL